MQARADGSYGAAEHGGRLGVRELLQLYEHERLAIFDGKPGDRRVQALHSLVHEQTLVAVERREIGRHVVGPTALEPQPIERHVASTTEQPRSHRAFGAVE